MNEAYEHIAICCWDNERFVLGSLLKDFDYLGNGTIAVEQFKKILSAGVSGPKGMTPGDIEYFI